MTGSPHPPPGRPGGVPDSELSRFLAKWLDDWLRIPGTNWRIGLDPLLALFPGLGSSLSSAAGVILLVEAVRCGVGLPVLIRMAGNLLLNTLFDFLPGAGPVASAFFKSNLRNLRLLQRWQAGQQQAVRRSTWRLFFGLALLLGLLAALLTGLVLLQVWLLRWLLTGA